MGRGDRRRARIVRSALFISMLLVMCAVDAQAASLSVTWSAPTTNADGTRLTDLAGYRVYLGTSPPACPGTPFSTVSSSTTTPSSGQTVSTVLTGLTAGATYYARITAVDSSGNESTCSGVASGVAQGSFGVTPTTGTSFGSVTTGTAVDRTFTVQNTSAANISGTATAAAPFSVASGSPFSLAPGASQNVTVRFRPTTTGTFASNVVFTAGVDTVSRRVGGTGTAATTVTLSVSKTGTGTGTVTSSPAGIACGATCSLSVAAGTPVTLTATPASGSTFGGWSGACSGTAACTLTMSTVVQKEQFGSFAYTLYAGSPTNRPNGYFNTGTTPSTERGVAGPSALPLNVWSHLATTYDGAALRLFVNGIQVASAPFSGAIVTTTGALRFGGNNVWGEFFRGYIDEIRIYNRALAPGEIQADMNTRIGN